MGTYRMTCNKGECNGIVFTDGADAKAHLVEVHGIRPITPGTRLTVKRLPSRPAVKPEKQLVAPGTEFVHGGYRCQVIGHTSKDRVAVLVWAHMDAPEPKTDRESAQILHTDPDGVRMYRLTAPAAKVAAAVTAATATVG